jgi:uncharacterized protein YjbI with pentapeptide repeats
VSAGIRVLDASKWNPWRLNWVDAASILVHNASMATLKQVAILQQGVSVWNSWRAEHQTDVIDLRRAHLRGAHLSGADLSGAHLSGASLGGAELSEANLREAHLSEAHLSGANLGGAELSEADLSGANLSGANLRETRLIGANLREADLGEADLGGAHLVRANLSGANLQRADLSTTRLGETVFADVDLSSTKGLESCRHLRPSIIDHRTLAKSGQLPPEFLRGCGLPDDFIHNLSSLFNQPIQFYSLFISYSKKDKSFARRLHADLQSKGVRCWFAEHDIEGGETILEQIDQAIRHHDRLLLILSPASMSSEWVKTEIAKALKRGRNEQRRVLFPIRLVAFKALRNWECFDADTGKDSAREIREYFIPDFSAWKDHDSYQKAFDRLLRALKKAETKKTT